MSCVCFIFFICFFWITLSTISEASITTIKAAMMINERLIFKTRGTWRIMSSSAAGLPTGKYCNRSCFINLFQIFKSHIPWIKPELPLIAFASGHRYRFLEKIFICFMEILLNTYMYWSRNDLKVSMKQECRESFWSCVASCEGSSSNKHFRASRNIVNNVPCFLCRNDSIASSSGFWVLVKNPLFLPETQSPPLAQREQAPTYVK